MFSSVQRTDKYWGVRQLVPVVVGILLSIVSPIALPPTFIPFFFLSLSLFPPDGCAGQLVPPPQKKNIKQKKKEPLLFATHWHLRAAATFAYRRARAYSTTQL